MPERVPMCDAERRAREDYAAELAETPNYKRAQGKLGPRPPWDGLPGFAKAHRIRLAERDLLKASIQGSRNVNEED